MWGLAIKLINFNTMKQFMPEANQKERLMIMQENAAKVEQTTYQRVLSPDELAARREDLADNCIKLNEQEDELNDIKADFKAVMDPLKKKNKSLLTEIKTKQSSTDGTLYHIANYDDGMMDTFDENGELVNSRRLRPEEKQGNIFAIGKSNNG